MHPEKTRLFYFRRPDRRSSKDADDRLPTFDLLGFTHFWERSLSKQWVVMRKTARDRFRRAVRSIWQWCMRHRHLELPAQHGALSRKIKGHYAYYGMARTPNGLIMPRRAARHGGPSRG